MAHLLQGYDDSTIYVKRCKAAVKQEVERLHKLSMPLAEELRAAGTVIGGYTDTGIQFLYCEAGKILTFAFNLHCRYRRRED